MRKYIPLAGTILLMFQNYDQVSSFSNQRGISHNSFGLSWKVPPSHLSQSVLLLEGKRRSSDDEDVEEEIKAKLDDKRGAPSPGTSSSSSSGKKIRNGHSARSGGSSINNGGSQCSYPFQTNDQEPESFVIGKALDDLRTDLRTLKHNLECAKAAKDYSRIDSLTQAIRRGEQRDPDYMYDKAYRLTHHTKGMKDATPEEKDALIENWSAIAERAKQAMPQFQMEGLWVGNFGDDSPQLVNITYKEDQIVATKVTGDRNVPRGETTFTVDLRPTNNLSPLPRVDFPDEAHCKEEHFQRFGGRGQVSRQGFQDSRYVEGQMILFEEDDQFGFVWIPIKHNILFTRPSPEQTIRLMRDTLSREDELENQRAHLTRCYNMDLSTCIARQQDPSLLFEPLRRITPQHELDEAEERTNDGKPKKRLNVLWKIQQWRKQFDRRAENGH